MRARLLTIALMAGASVFSGCGTTGVYRDWDAPTEFRFASLTENEADAYQSVFDHHEVDRRLNFGRRRENASLHRID